MDFKGVIKVKKVLHFVIGDAAKKKHNQSIDPSTNQIIQNQLPIESIKAVNVLIKSIFQLID